MQKIFKKAVISFRVVYRGTHICKDTSSRKRGFVDTEKKIVYGGDLSIPISDESVASVLFNRMLRMDRRDEIFQISSTSRVAMTTRECLENSVALAEKLKESGIQKGDFILLVGNNSLIMNISLLGIIFSGAVPVPISFKTSFSEFEIITKSLKPKFFGCAGKYLDLYKRAISALPEFDSSKIFLLDQETEAKTDIPSFADFIKGKGKDFESFQPPGVENPEEEILLGIKRTSDGPGVKIIGITHRNANSTIAQFDSIDEKRPYRNDVVLMVKKVFWLSGLGPLLMTSCYGSKLVVMEKFDEESFFKVINDFKVTNTFLFSSKCWRIYKHNPVGKYDLSSCKRVYCDDGYLPEALVRAWKEKFGITLLPSFAVNEIAGFSLMPTEGNLKPNSSGKLIPGLYGKVISPTTFENLGPNEGGEICFKGPTVMKGFINDEESKHHLFDKDGFLLTGIYGYYDEDGSFFVVDRVRHQINSENRQVSPKEVEGVVRILHSVKDVLVAGIPHPDGGQKALAFVVLEEKSNITEKEILDFVNSHLEDHKKILAVVILPKIPKFRRTGAHKRELFSYILSKYRVKVDATKEDKKPDT